MKNKIKCSLVITLSLVILLAACSNKDEVLPPVDIQEGIDRCEVCHMLISNDRNAVQLRLKDGQSLKFDDIGDLFVWTDEHGLDDVNVRYVRDYYTEQWLPIEEASFVYHAEFRTPMSYGVYSFKNKEEAEQFLADQGKGELLTYEDLEHHHWESAMGHGHEHGDGHGHNDGHVDHDGNGADHDHGHENEDGHGHDDANGHEVGHHGEDAHVHEDRVDHDGDGDEFEEQ